MCFIVLFSECIFTQCIWVSHIFRIILLFQQLVGCSLIIMFVHKATIPLETVQDIVLQQIGEVQMLLMYTMRLQKEPVKRLGCSLLTLLISWESCGIELVIGVIITISALIWRWCTLLGRSFQTNKPWSHS
jgi:hypothetical protein